jgi:hypothetical protein
MNKEQLFLKIDEIYSEYHGFDTGLLDEKSVNLIKENIEKLLILHIVSHRRELLYAFINTMEFDTKHETYEEDIEYFLKENSSI